MKTGNLIAGAIAALMILSGSCNSRRGDYNLNLTMEVSCRDFLTDLSANSQDITFRSALTRAEELQQNEQSDFITLFEEAFQEIDPDAKLAAIFSTVELKDKINFNSTNAEVLAVIRSEFGTAIDNSAKIISARLHKFGVPRRTYKINTDGNRIKMEISRIKNPEGFKKLLTSTARLEFRETYENSEVIGYLIQANEYLRNLKTEQPASAVISNTSVETTAENPGAENELSADQTLLDLLEGDTAQVTPGKDEEFNFQNPLFGILIPRADNEGQPLTSCLIGLSLAKDTALVNKYLKMDQVMSLFPRDMKLYWSRTPYKYDESGTLYELHAIKISTRDGRPPLDGSVIINTEPSANPSGDAAIRFSMYPEGARKWQRITRDNIGRCIAVILDGYVISYPRVQMEISGGNTEITGDFSFEEAADLANILNSGPLPLALRIIEAETKPLNEKD